MSTHLALTRTSERMLRFLEEHSKTNYNGSIEDFLPLLQTIQNIFPTWVLMTCPVKHARSRFITENCESILDITPEFFRTALTSEFLFAQIHEDDQPDVHQCFLFADNFIKNRLPEEYPHLRLVMQYRYCRRDLSYITLHDEKGALTLPDGTVLYYAIIKDITEEMVFSGVKLDIYRKDARLEKLAVYNPQAANSLSKRETQLIGLLKRGLTAKEMAYHLNISQHTVRNIKQKMFEKYRVNNVVELLNKAIYYN